MNEQILAILAKHPEGLSVDKLALKLGKSPNNIYVWFSKRGAGSGVVRLGKGVFALESLMGKTNPNSKAIEEIRTAAGALGIEIPVGYTATIVDQTTKKVATRDLSGNTSQKILLGAILEMGIHQLEIGNAGAIEFPKTSDTPIVLNKNLKVTPHREPQQIRVIIEMERRPEELPGVEGLKQIHKLTKTALAKKSAEIKSEKTRLVAAIKSLEKHESEIQAGSKKITKMVADYTSANKTI